MSPISYDLKGAAQVTGLSQSHLKRVIGEGLLKAKRTSERDGEPVGKYVILAGDLEAYVRELVDA
jgi:hypothetical protein